MRKQRLIGTTAGILLALIPLACCGLSIGLPIRLNNRSLQSFADNLYNYPLPPKTEVVDRRAEVGLMGNGNHCDFVAEQILVSELSREELEGYYQDVKLPSAKKGSQLAQDGLLGVQLSFEAYPSAEEQVYFTIRILDGGYSPGLDIRCH
jgi:hypothetical protein